MFKGYAKTEPVRLFMWAGALIAGALAGLKVVDAHGTVLQAVIAGLEVLVPVFSATEAARATAWSPASVEAVKPTVITPEVAGAIGMPTPPPEPEAPARRRRGERGAVEPGVIIAIAVLVALAIWVHSLVAAVGAAVLIVLVLVDAYRRPPRT